MDTTAITRDTLLCTSLAARPSNVGTRFHNWLYRELGLDFVYKASRTDDLAGAIAGVRALGIRGCGVSMPFKQDVIALLDSVDEAAAAIGAVNTVVNTEGQLHGYNTDYLSVRGLLEPLPVRGGFVVLGSGGMARAVLAALHGLGWSDGTVVARNEGAGRALAQQYGYHWQPALGKDRPALLVNATPIGMAGGSEADRLPVDAAVVEAATTVVDVVGFPAETPLVRVARDRGTQVVTGAEIQELQAVEQFALYTGVRPGPDVVRRATSFARSE